MSATARATTADGVEIAYDVIGDPAGSDIVLVHGITDDRATWDPIVPLLAASHRVIRLDLRGHGESGDADDYGALAMAADVAAVLVDVDAQAPVLVGHSLGGFVVTALAAQVPVRGIVNVDQPLRMSAFSEGLAPIAPMLRGSVEEFRQALGIVFDVLGQPDAGPAVLASLAEHRATARQDVVLGVWEMALSMPGDELDAVVEGALSAVVCPYLSVHGSEPGDDYRAWLARALPQADIQVWDGAGHYLHLVDPQRFVDLVLAAAL